MFGIWLRSHMNHVCVCMWCWWSSFGCMCVYVCNVFAGMLIGHIMYTSYVFLSCHVIMFGSKIHKNTCEWRNTKNRRWIIGTHDMTWHDMTWYDMTWSTREHQVDNKSTTTATEQNMIVHSDHCAHMIYAILLMDVTCTYFICYDVCVLMYRNYFMKWFLFDFQIYHQEQKWNQKKKQR